MTRFDATGPREALTYFDRGNIITRFVKRRKRTIFGGQSIANQTGLFARPTSDYDIDTPQPRRDATQLQRILDRRAGSDVYFSRESKFKKGVFKTIHKGEDRLPDTKDDIGIADFSKHNYPYTTVRGVRYAKLSTVIADKKRALADKEFEYRHAKDRQDVERIRAYQMLRTLQGRR